MPKAVGESPTPSLSLRIPEQSVAASSARRETPFSRKGDNAAFAPRRSCSIPGLLCVWDVHASLGLCRSPLPLAFDLEKPTERDDGSEAHDANKPRPSSLKLAFVAYCQWCMGLLCAQKVSPNPAYTFKFG
jgi:hypothetical protein